ncbi:hypothetical protein [Pseudoalteromonas sp. R3]|uniref:hypothetical protein n=1 Tax=Pseudoalteromonas sp. R3 TaxID=1709477 RepID=UPI000B0EFA4E|nr:hypothetical protein [Pseudoalteromonas sp. R3]AZZ95814.1 hypothetical protein ELR70_00965 [Pseudoalteromonas sp. R3]
MRYHECRTYYLKSGVDYDSDYEVMDGGQGLIYEIAKKDIGSWLVVHGHKHFASINEAAVDTHDKPLIFSAGSFSAKLYPSINERTSNQFYLIDIDIEKTENEGILTGTFETHSWNIDQSWHPSTVRNLPYQGGFGSTISPMKIVRKINEMLDEQPFLNERDLAPVHEMCKHYTPGRFEELVNKLDRANIKLEIANNRIIEASK